MKTSKLSNLLVAVLLFGSVTPTIAQNRGNTRNGGVQVGGKGAQLDVATMQEQIQQISQKLEEGEPILNEAMEKASEARQVWQKADAKHKENVLELNQAKKLAEEEANSSPEYIAAKIRVEELHRELADVRKKFVEKLTLENEDYQQACKVHQKAIAEQKVNSGANVAQETRKELSKKVSDADKSKKILEDVAMADNSEVKELTKQIKEAVAELGAASKKKAETIKEDLKLNSAKTAHNRSLDSLKKAKADLNQADGEANRIRGSMQVLFNRRASIQTLLQAQPGMRQAGNVNQQGGNRAQQGGNGNQQNGNKKVGAR